MARLTRIQVTVSGLRTSDNPVIYTAYEENTVTGKTGVEFTDSETACWYFVPMHRLLEIKALP